MSFWKKLFQDYCSIKIFPDLDLFRCAVEHDEQIDEKALVIADACNVSGAGEKSFFWLEKIFSLKKVFFAASSQVDEKTLQDFESLKANLIPFPCDFDSVKNQIKLSASLTFEKSSVSDLKSMPSELRRLTGESFALKSLRSNLFAFGKTDLPLILEGETGTGKTLAAELIHKVSGRKNCCFRRINMPCVQEEIVESELFGTVSGAFTGAVNKKGILEETNGGTVLFDEISEIPLRFQAKLLKFLDSGCFSRVGSTQERYADVRVICATNSNLEELVERGLFRRDLYERLKGKVIELPALDSRKEDIGPLIQNFLLEKGRSQITFTPEAISALQKRRWKGNIRELKNCVELTCSVTDKKVIGPEDLVFAG